MVDGGCWMQNAMRNPIDVWLHSPIPNLLSQGCSSRSLQILKSVIAPFTRTMLMGFRILQIQNTLASLSMIQEK